MRKGGGGFGILMLIVVAAIVLLLAARNWQAVAPTATQLDDDPVPSLAAPTRVEGESIPSGQLPDLNDMRQSTATHAQELADALRDSE